MKVLVAWDRRRRQVPLNGMIYYKGMHTITLHNSQVIGHLGLGHLGQLQKKKHPRGELRATPY